MMRYHTTGRPAPVSLAAIKKADICKQCRIYIAKTKNTGLAAKASPIDYFGKYSSLTRYRLMPKLPFRSMTSLGS